MSGTADLIQDASLVLREVRAEYDQKPLLVGESNPYCTDPRYALYPMPSGAANRVVKDSRLKLRRALKAADRVQRRIEEAQHWLEGCIREQEACRARMIATDVVEVAQCGYCPCCGIPCELSTLPWSESPPRIK